MARLSLASLNAMIRWWSGSITTHAEPATVENCTAATRQLILLGSEQRYHPGQTGYDPDGAADDGQRIAEVDAGSNEHNPRYNEAHQPGHLIVVLIHRCTP